MQKTRKNVLYVLLLLLITTGVIYFLFSQTSRVKSLVKKYNYWSDPGVIYHKQVLTGSHTSQEKINKKLHGLLSSECQIILTFADGQSDTLTKDEFIKAISKARFITFSEQAIFDGPAIKKDKDYFSVNMTKSFQAGNIIEVADCQLAVKRYGRRFLISEIKRTYRKPLKNEIERLYKIPKQKKGGKLFSILKRLFYIPKLGLGARFLGGGNFHFTNPSFSPDGKKIVFTSLRHNSGEIYTINTDDSGLKRLTRTRYWEIEPSFTPDGKSILFLSDRDNYGGEPFLIDADGSNYRRLVSGYFGVSDACYSPDGDYVAFTVQDGEARDIYIMESDSSDIRRLTRTGRINSHLVFSPDGQTIYFRQKWYDRSKDPPLCMEICSVDIDGKDMKQLTFDRLWKTPIAVTHNHILFVRERTTDLDNSFNEQGTTDRLWLIKIDGSAEKMILAKSIEAYHEGTRLLPNNKEIILVLGQVDKYYVYYLYLRDLFGNKTMKQLTGDGDCCRSEVGVSADGKYIVYLGEPRGEVKNGKGYIRIVSLETGEIKTICKNY